MNPTNVKYTKDHEWARIDGKIAVIGITEYASKQLGDVVFVDMPQPGTKLEKGKTLGVIESVKTVSDIFAPVSGKVSRKNEELENDPALVNQDPFGKGWILEVEFTNKDEMEALMDAKEYEKHCESSGH